MDLAKMFEECWAEGHHGEPPPRKWEICDRCAGDGVLGGFPGVYTSDDFASGEVDFDEYMAYKRDCEDCGGTGKLLNFTGEAEELWIEWLRDDADDRAVRRAESGWCD
jgi:DnaJ-class molecular chaperone